MLISVLLESDLLVFISMALWEEIRRLRMMKNMETVSWTQIDVIESKLITFRSNQAVSHTGLYYKKTPLI